MSRFIIIDTCVWIGLAREPNLYDLLETLKKILDKKNFVLVLPESVKIEFERHRVKITADWNNKCKGLISGMKDGRKHFPDHAEDLLKLHNEIQNTLANLNSNVENNLKLVDALFEQAVPMNNCSELMLAEAGKRVFNRIAPALNSRSSSVGDCLLWSAVLESLKKGDVWFCTDNKHDFSQRDCYDSPHEDLKKETLQSNAKGMFNYFIDPSKFIQQIAEIKEELPKYYQYVLDRDAWAKPTMCPSCKTMSAIPYIYSTGYRYICKNCGGASQFNPSDDPFY
jgi:PIN domain